MLATREMIVVLDRSTGDWRAREPGPFQDIPQSIWRVFLSAWGILFLMFAVFFTINAAASFAVTIAAMFAVMAFGLPTVMAAVGRCEGHQCGDIIQTHTGPLSVAEASVQILLIPIAADIGLAAFIAFAI